MKKGYTMPFTKVKIGEETYKVTLDMMKLIKTCKNAGVDIDEILIFELFDMDNSMLNNDRTYSENNKQLSIFPPNVFKTESAENEVIRNLTHGQLDELLVGCTEKQRDRFLKNKYYGYTIKQIANHENVNERNVKESIAIAKKRFLENANK